MEVSELRGTQFNGDRSPDDESGGNSLNFNHVKRTDSGQQSYRKPLEINHKDAIFSSG